MIRTGNRGLKGASVSNSGADKETKRETTRDRAGAGFELERYRDGMVASPDTMICMIDSGLYR